MKLLAWLVEADEWGNVLIGGSEEQTISARAWQAHIEGTWFRVFVPLIDLLFYPGHCQMAYIDWVNGKATPEP